MNSKLGVSKAKKHGKKSQKHKTKVSKLRAKEGSKEIPTKETRLSLSPK